MEGAAQYRKFINVLVTGGLMFAMNRYGIKPEQLQAIGLTMGDIQTGLLDFLQVIVIPAVVGVLAQPNTIGDKLLDNWRWIAGGLGVVLAAGIVIAVW